MRILLKSECDKKTNNIIPVNVPIPRKIYGNIIHIVDLRPTVSLQTLKCIAVVVLN